MGKVWVITGGTSGIGRGIAEKILADSAEGDMIIISYASDQKRAEGFLETLPAAQKSRVCLARADMSSYEEMLSLAGLVRERAGHVDHLVSNAGVSTYARFEDYTFEEWTRIVNTNLSVPVFFIKELRPLMRRGGSILLTGSYAGQQAYSSSLVYGVTKAAVHFLARSLVKELEPLGVRVNAIAPGFIRTPWHDGRSRESYERIERKIALHRFGEVEEVADMAYAMLKNGYLNGSVVDIHGGYDYF